MVSCPCRALTCFLALVCAFTTPAGAVTLPWLSFIPFFAPKVTVEYDHTAPLVRQTYSWGGVQMAVPVYAAPVRAAVDKRLQTRGWQLTQSGGGVTMFVHGNVRGQRELEATYGKQDGGWGAGQWDRHGLGLGWKPDYGEATVNALGTAEGHLVVDGFDTATHRLVFRGVTAERLGNKEEDNREDLRRRLKQMFKKFPPKK